MIAQEPRLAYSCRELSELLGVSHKAVYDRVKEGSIASVRLGRRILIPESEVERLLDPEHPEGVA